MRAPPLPAIGVCGFLLVVGSGCDPHKVDLGDIQLTTLGKTTVSLRDCEFDPADGGQGGDAGGTFTCDGVKLTNAPDGTRVRVTIGTDEGDSGNIKPGEQQWDGGTSPPALTPRPHETESPAPHEITDPIPIRPGRRKIVVIVVVEEPYQPPRSRKLIVDARGGRLFN